MDNQAPCIVDEETGKEPNCPYPETKMGYGMAGGGMGVYEYCPLCGFIYSKTQDKS